MLAMRRWGFVWIASILLCLPVFVGRSSAPSMLADTDTAYLIKVIREVQNPLHWFTGDWPLGNHFYRPISTLVFEFDNAVYGNSAAGYGATNALLCCLCILGLAWLLRELTDSIPITLGGVLLFAMWHGSWGPEIGSLTFYTGLAVGFLGFFRHGFRLKQWLPAIGAFSLLAWEIAGQAALHFRMVDWIPGRTASTMTVFGLVAMAAYARYERLGAVRKEPLPTSLDEPAGTRSSVLETRASGGQGWLWAVLSIAALALALGSYEQAVMLPAALLGVAISLKLQRYQVRWGWQIGFWILLVGYLILRKLVLPDGSSGYQEQQFRNGPGVFMSLSAYILPCAGSLYMLIRVLDLGLSLFLTSQLYGTIWQTYSNFAGFLAASRHWVLALTGYALSVLAYLPMAWLNQFEHYHYWPMALRSLFVAILAWGAWELAVIAVSPPARRAPQRHAPAPGSLPHP